MKKSNILKPCKGHDSNPTVVYEPCCECNKTILTGTTQNIKATFKWPDGDEVQHYRWEFINTPNEKITLI